MAKADTLAAGASPIDGPYAWLRLGISVVMATIGGAGMWAVVVVLPQVQAEFGVDRANASLPYTATMIGFAAGNVLVGRAIDRFGYWRPALMTSIGLSAGFVLASLTQSIVQFALVQGVLIGVGCSAIFGPLIADISHCRPTRLDSRRPEAWPDRMFIRRRAGSGSFSPLTATLSSSPSVAEFSTRRAVDALSITPPGGAADSIRCAMPTCSPSSPKTTGK